MKKQIKKRCNRKLGREVLSNPFPNETLKKRLVYSEVIDYRDNHTLEDLGNGYMKISPKDKKRLLRL